MPRKNKGKGKKKNKTNSNNANVNKSNNDHNSPPETHETIVDYGVSEDVASNFYDPQLLGTEVSVASSQTHSTGKQVSDHYEGPIPQDIPSTIILTSDPRTWTTDQVSYWVNSLSPDMKHASEIFHKNRVVGELLFELDKGDLSEMGITEWGVRKLLLKRIKELGSTPHDMIAPPAAFSQFVQPVPAYSPHVEQKPADMAAPQIMPRGQNIPSPPVSMHEPARISPMDHIPMHSVSRHSSSAVPSSSSSSSSSSTDSSADERGDPRSRYHPAQSQPTGPAPAYPRVEQQYDLLPNPPQNRSPYGENEGYNRPPGENVNEPNEIPNRKKQPEPISKPNQRPQPQVQHKTSPIRPQPSGQPSREQSGGPSPPRPQPPQNIYALYVENLADSVRPEHLNEEFGNGVKLRIHFAASKRDAYLEYYDRAPALKAFQKATTKKGVVIHGKKIRVRKVFESDLVALGLFVPPPTTRRPESQPMRSGPPVHPPGVLPRSQSDTSTQRPREYDQPVHVRRGSGKRSDEEMKEYLRGLNDRPVDSRSPEQRIDDIRSQKRRKPLPPPRDIPPESYDAYRRDDRSDRGGDYGGPRYDDRYDDGHGRYQPERRGYEYQDQSSYERDYGGGYGGPDYEPQPYYDADGRHESRDDRYKYDNGSYSSRRSSQSGKRPEEELPMDSFFGH